MGMSPEDIMGGDPHDLDGLSGGGGGGSGGSAKKKKNRRGGKGKKKSGGGGGGGADAKASASNGGLGSTPLAGYSDDFEGGASEMKLASEPKAARPQLPLETGGRVLVRETMPGRVHFIGEVHYAKGEWCGVELDEPLGKNNGTIKGVSYFSCEHQHGIMVRPAECTAIDA